MFHVVNLVLSAFVGDWLVANVESRTTTKASHP